MWQRRVWLMCLMIAPHVVVFPDEVGPVTRSRPPVLVRQLLDDGGELEICEVRRVREDATRRDPQGAALTVDVDAEASEARDGVREVDLAFAVELLALFGSHHRPGQRVTFLGPQHHMIQRLQEAAYADRRWGAGLDVKV